MSWKSVDVPVGNRCLKLEINLADFGVKGSKESRFLVETKAIDYLPGKPVNVKRVSRITERRYTVLFASLVVTDVVKVPAYSEAWEVA